MTGKPVEVEVEFFLLSVQEMNDQNQVIISGIRNIKKEIYPPKCHPIHISYFQVWCSLISKTPILIFNTKNDVQFKFLPSPWYFCGYQSSQKYV
jgi:hypothetical protein